MSYILPVKKIRQVLHLLGQGESKHGIARKLKISRNTIRRYSGKLKTHNSLYPDKIHDLGSIISDLFVDKKISERRAELLKLFPEMLKQLESRTCNLITAWRQYKVKFPQGYAQTNFYSLFEEWRKSIGVKELPFYKWKIISIPENDLNVLKDWRRSSDRRKWEKAVVLLESNKGCDIKNIAVKVERSPDKVKEWISAYEKNGLKALFKRQRKVNDERVEYIKTKKSNLIKLIHETPHLHGINRASWCLKSLSIAYQKIFGETISKSTISEYIKAEGYSFRKAKEVLTSPDPEYREKLERITNILSKLTEKEKFFSVDEYEPFSVKIKGGRSIVKNGETKSFPQRQKSKGFLICTAALELSTNQVLS